MSPLNSILNDDKVEKYKDETGGKRIRMIIHVLKWPDQKSEKKDRKERGMDKLMTCLTNEHDASAAMLTNSCKKQERPIPINLSVSSGQSGLQMTINVGIEKGKTMNNRKFNSLLMEMAIMDFFHCENSPDRAVESNHFCKILDVVKVVSSGTIRNKIELSHFFKLKPFLKIVLKNILFIHR